MKWRFKAPEIQTKRVRETKACLVFRLCSSIYCSLDNTIYNIIYE